MSVAAKCLIEAKYAANADTTQYTVPGPSRVIIDSFTATNTDASAQTITINLIPSGNAVGAGNIISSAVSIAAGASIALSEMKNQVLEAGDIISTKASIASKVVIRASGRVIT